MDSRCAVLVVDDEPLILNLLKSVLGHEFAVLTASTAEEVRALLEQRPVEIILSDHYLSGCGNQFETGVQLLEWVRQHHPRTVRFLMTGYASLENAVDAINRGRVQRLFFKPLNIDWVQEALHEAAETLFLAKSHAELHEQLRQLNQELEHRVQLRTQELEEANRQLQQKNLILERMALTDPLTGIPNRWAMDRLVRTEIQRRARHPSPLTLLIADVDHFKDVNTRYLLPGGDHALISLGQILTQSVRAADTVGRIGGEEFMILAPDTDYEGAVTLAERLRQAVEGQSTVYNGEPIRLTVSIGGAVAAADATPSYEQLRELASAALADAKSKGRNQCDVRRFTTAPPSQE